MAQAIGGLQGSEELMRWLSEQDKLERDAIKKGTPQPNISGQAGGKAPRVAPRQFPTGRTTRVMGGTMASTPQAGGAFMKTAGMGAKLGAGALRAAGPIGVGASLAPVAWGAGEIIGDSYYDTAMEDEYAKPNPYVEEFSNQARAAGRPAVNQSSKTVAGGPPTGGPASEFKTNRGLQLMDSVPPEPGLDFSSLHGDPNTVAIDTPVEVVEEVPAGMDVEATGMDPQLQEIVDVASVTQPTPYEAIDPAHEATIKSATTNLTDRPTKKPSAWSKFWRAGAGPIDWDRAEKQQLELHQRQNQLTDREKLGLAHASGQVEGAQSFNRQGKMKEYDTGGQAPLAKYMSDILAGDRRQDRGEGVASRLGQEQHDQNMQRDRSNLRGMQGDPNSKRQDAQYKAMLENPDLWSPEDHQRMFGMVPDKTGLQSIRDARMTSAMANQMRQQEVLDYLRSRQGARSGTPASKTTPAKKDEKKPEKGKLATESLR